MNRTRPAGSSWASFVRLAVALGLCVGAAGWAARGMPAGATSQATGTVEITKSIVDAAGVAVAGADRSGFVFGFGRLVDGSIRSPDLIYTTTAAGTTSATLAPGTYRLFERLRGSCQAREVRIGGIPVGGPTLQLSEVMSSVEFTLGAGQRVSIAVANTCPGAGMGTGMMSAGTTRSDRLVAGCTNLALTFPAGTPLASVAQGVSTGAGLLSIFRLDAASGRFLGYSPAVPAFANDYTTVGARLEAVFICVRAAGTLTQPEV